MDQLLVARINLAVQVLVFAILVAGFLLIRKRKGKFFLHGAMMLTAVILNIFSFLLVMGPSLLNLEIVRSQPFHEYSLVIMAHGVLGGLAMVFGVFIVVSWHLQSSARSCLGKKNAMKATFALWAIALILGVLLYYILYGFS